MDIRYKCLDLLHLLMLAFGTNATVKHVVSVLHASD